MANLTQHRVFIGRFQPFHLGHKQVIDTAFEQCDHVIVLVGSANSPRTLKNPFSFEERAQMILGAFESLPAHKTLTCLPLNDATYNDQRWLRYVQSAVASVTKDDHLVGIIGHNKDSSSYYLHLFPQWQFWETASFADGLSATPIRMTYFQTGAILQDKLPQSSTKLLAAFYDTPAYAQLHQEYQAQERHHQSWQHAPYPPTFITADAVVIMAGHILLIERGGDYGHGLWALAGGFVDGNETFVECAIRELKEEAGIDVRHLSPKKTAIFDAPDRSLRGRTVTMAVLFELTGDTLPTPSAGDDASRAFWLPLSELEAVRMFEDHYAIICQMLGI